MGDSQPIPRALYVHIPWCIKKCPYCDFNSHKAPDQLPQSAYIEALLTDLEQERANWGSQAISSIFIGGGTPSLFSAQHIDQLLQGVDRIIGIRTDAEITLEANPGAAETARFADYRHAGINRLSIGVQSFDDLKLQALGRVHDSDSAKQAIRSAKTAGFKRINVDLMHGLPGQSSADALSDIETALAFETEHLSWYQLTLEPNTAFYKHPPTLPQEGILAETQQAGAARLRAAGFEDYEVSAWSQPGRESQHNLNYWQFGDYYAIGAGAHGKITLGDDIWRYQKTRRPEDYLSTDGTSPKGQKAIPRGERGFEFLMNALRLKQGFSPSLFEQRTGTPWLHWQVRIEAARKLGLLEQVNQQWRCTSTGRNYLDDLLSRWLPD